MKVFTQHKAVTRMRRHGRIRAKISGTAERPRLSVFRGARSMYAQLIDDTAGTTIVAVHSGAVKVDAAGERSAKVALAFAVGKAIAEAAKAKGITTVVFDRGGFRYHGRVRAVADGAREAGLIF
ncbi:MAG: 50S ribosomal protein L18 [Patescibacteria group bacterium]